ncbi:MAG TPA: hypothetical protein VFA50_05630 [Stellaceae bacterium]|nr:hypothetical protein [Stellaceae bacterium]
MTPESHERASEIEMCFREFGLEGDRSFAASGGFLVPAEFAELAAEIGKRLGVARLERQRLLETGHRLGPAPEGRERAAEIVVGDRITRAELDGALVRSHGLVETLQGGEDHSEVVVRFGRIRIAVQSFVQKAQGVIEPTFPGANDSEKLQRPDMARLCTEHRRAPSRGLGRLSALEQ